MNAWERIDNALEEWVQNLRGHTSGPGLQPKDVLRRILTALEDNRIEGLDNKMYAPNVYLVELNLDGREQERLLPFLGEEEIKAALQRYAQEHKYQFRGPLELQIVSRLNTQTSIPGTPPPLPPHPNVTDDGKVRVEARYHAEGAPTDWNTTSQQENGTTPRSLETTGVP